MRVPRAVLRNGDVLTIGVEPHCLSSLPSTARAAYFTAFHRGTAAGGTLSQHATCVDVATGRSGPFRAALAATIVAPPPFATGSNGAVAAAFGHSTCEALTL